MDESESRLSPPGDFATARSQAAALQSGVWSEGHALALFGSLAVWLVCSANIRSWLEEKRSGPRDLDFIAFSSSRSVVVASLHELGYRENRELAVMTEGYLYRFAAPTKLTAEIRFDELKFAHTTSLLGRLTPGQATVSLPDLILSKLLIVDLKTPDMWDLFALFVEDAETKMQDMKAWSTCRERLLGVLGKSWGAWYTANLSLGKLEDAFGRLGESPSKATGNAIQATISELRSSLASCPKSLMWRARAMIGSHWRWFEETAEVPEHHLSGDGKE